MAVYVGYCLASWATGYVIGAQVRSIRDALTAA